MNEKPELGEVRDKYAAFLGTVASELEPLQRQTALLYFSLLPLDDSQTNDVFEPQCDEPDEESKRLKADFYSFRRWAGWITR